MFQRGEEIHEKSPLDTRQFYWREENGKFAESEFEGFPICRMFSATGSSWSEGYFARTVEDKVTAEVIQRYIQYQHRAEQLELDL